MRQLKTLLVLTVLMLVASTALQARERMEGDRHKRLFEALQLTEDQAAKVKPILDEQNQKWRELRKNKDLDPAQAKAQMDAIHAECRQQLAQVLNAEQLATFDKMSASMHEHARDRMGYQLAGKLQLNEEQAKSVRTIMEEQRTKREEIRSSDISRDEKRAQMQALEDETHTRLSQVLNEEQMKGLQDMHRHRRGRDKPEVDTGADQTGTKE